MPKKPRRTGPAVGTVISIPINKGNFAYAVLVYSYKWWIFDFKTNQRTNNPSDFISSRWLKYISIHKGIGIDTFDECVVELGPHEENHPPTWTRMPQWAVDCGECPTPFKVRQFKLGVFVSPEWYVSEEEAATMQESISLE
jgi:hypothetical protein